jgi:glycosyltransferase involved in cell wall biosynthesis
MISLIATVLNEGESIHRLMHSLLAQTRLPDEIVIVDGGSRDNTVALIQSYADRLPLRVLVEPGANISEGRNRAIAAAQGDIIAVTDAGVEVVPDWLEKITRPLIEDASCEVVGGFFNPEYTNLFELAMSATVLPLKDEINPATFLPSSRSVAFRKAVWQTVGGYPEWLDYCEDLVFDLSLKQFLNNRTFAFEPEAVVAFRPRGSLRSFFKQYYLYARGDGKADLWRKRHAARYLTYWVALPIILWLGAAVHPLLWLLLLAGGYVYLRQPYTRLGKLVARGKLQGTSDMKPPPQPSPVNEGGNKNYSVSELAYLIGMVLIIRVVGDIAKMLGYPAGWLWRLRNHPPNWKGVTISP